VSVDPDEASRVDGLRRAVELALPILRDAADHARAAGLEVDAQLLTHIRRSLARAVDRWATDTQPIDVS
jgi:hypothetical protein